MDLTVSPVSDLPGPYSDPAVLHDAVAARLRQVRLDDAESYLLNAYGQSGDEPSGDDEVLLSLLVSPPQRDDGPVMLAVYFSTEPCRRTDAPELGVSLDSENFDFLGLRVDPGRFEPGPPPSTKVVDLEELFAGLGRHLFASGHRWWTPFSAITVGTLAILDVNGAMDRLWDGERVPRPAMSELDAELADLVGRGLAPEDVASRLAESFTARLADDDH